MRRTTSLKIDELLNKHYNEFSVNEKYICNYLVNHYDECVNNTVEEFSKSCNVSKTMMVRFAKKLGLSGYSELRARIKIERQEQQGDVNGLLQTMTESYHKMMDELVKEDFSSFFIKLKNAERVFVYGSGSSQSRVASEMKRIFLPVKEMIDLHGHDLCDALKRIATPNDLVIIISLSGESEPVVDLAQLLRTKNVSTVSVTSLSNNKLASLCEDNLYIHSVRVPSQYQMDYEFATPYFILIEYLYLSYQVFLQKDDLTKGVQ